jgi:hypothetical protein
VRCEPLVGVLEEHIEVRPLTHPGRSQIAWMAKIIHYHAGKEAEAQRVAA